jgi:hypothetical protein
MSVSPLIECQELLSDPRFIDEKEQLKEYLGKAVETIVMQNQKKTDPYFIVFHERSDDEISRMKISVRNDIPGYVTNTIVFWVCNRRGICEWLWTVPHKAPAEHKIKPVFNTEGVAYLQAKGAMPK